MPERIYKYSFSTNYIKYNLDYETKDAYMEETYIDNNYFKIYLLLLKKSICEFIDEGYMFFHQTIPKEDHAIIKTGNWKIKNIHSDYFLYIYCDICDALENISKALGIENL